MVRSEKVRENRLRRAARRQGLRLQKSRTRDPRALTYGGYWLVDEERNDLVYGNVAGRGPAASLDEIEAWLLAPVETVALRRAAGSP